MTKNNEAVELYDKLKDPLWRLENLYYIKDKKGNKVLFKPNWMQKELISNQHNQMLMLKARQLGSTTISVLLYMDKTYFSDIIHGKTVSTGIIAHRREDAENIFYDKVKFAYDNFPDWVKSLNPARNDSARELRFQDGSSLRVSTSMRSGTFQQLLITEFGKICKTNPLLADEVMTGSLQTVDKDESVIIESTAEGRSGHFFELCQKYQKFAEAGKKLTPLDMKFMFFPWYKHPDYVLYEPTIIDRESVEYFEELEAKYNIELTEHQKAWYFKKKEILGEKMSQEYPSTPDEAFESGIEGYYYSKEMSSLRKLNRITRVPYDPSCQVHVSFDLGINDATALWFCQLVGQEIHLIDYYESNNESLAHYINYINAKHNEWPNLVYGKFLFPFDVESKELTTGQTRKKTIEGLGIKVTVVPKIPIYEGIHKVRMMLPRCWIDEEKCSIGIKHLDAYRKDFSSKYGIYTDKPHHDWASNGCDSIRYLFTALEGIERGIGGMSPHDADRLEAKYKFIRGN